MAMRVGTVLKVSGPTFRNRDAQVIEENATGYIIDIGGVGSLFVQKKKISKNQAGNCMFQGLYAWKVVS